jgi:gamma-glutamylcyclotransferase (GGCT)/AIG2-like uncharacterized protein YtfP
MTEQLFVYGTLAPGQANQHVLADLPGTWEPATVRGHLVQEGWGAGLGFPGILLDEYGPEVRGLLFASPQLNEHWVRLDEFEGDGYQRVRTVVRRDDGRTTSACIYTLRRDSDR